jgi:hypothetical protein
VAAAGGIRVRFQEGRSELEFHQLSRCSSGQEPGRPPRSGTG